MKLLVLLFFQMISLACAYTQVELSPELEQKINAQNEDKTPLQSFFKESRFKSVLMSPDGRHLGIVGNHEGQGVLYITTSDLSKVVFVHKVVDRHIWQFNWANNERIMFWAGKKYGYLDGRHSDTKLYFVNFDGSNFRRFFDNAWADYDLLDLLVDENDHVLLHKRHYRDYMNPIAIRINVYTGRMFPVASPGKPGSLMTDNQGRVRVHLEYDYRKDYDKLIVNYRETDRGAWKPFNVKLDAPYSLQPLAFDSDKHLIYMLIAQGGGTEKLYAVSTKSQKMTLVHEHPTHDLEKPIFDDQRLVGIKYDDGKHQFLSVDSDSKVMQLYENLSRSFPEQSIYNISLSKDKTKGVVAVGSLRHPVSFYRLDLGENRIVYLDSSRPLIDPKKMAKTEYVSFKARDGLQIHGYITKPLGQEDKPHPLLVIPHGGPHGIRDRSYFDPDTQFFADRGFTVLKVNFRGSGGYGLNFTRLGYRQWGGTMQDDLTDAVHWAIENGHGIKDKTCIFGASYGGYAALMSAIREPDLYRCAVGFVGVYDFFVQRSRSDTGWFESGEKYFDKVFSDDPDLQKKYSPRFHADKIKAKVMLVHGKDDERVPYKHFELMNQALIEAGNPPVTLVKDQEGHGFTKEGNRFELYYKVLEFIRNSMNKEGDKNADPSVEKQK